MVGDADLCKKASDLLLERHSIYIQPINYPTVAVGTERLRITPTPRHTDEQIGELVEALVDVWRTLKLPFTTAEIVMYRGVVGVTVLACAIRLQGGSFRTTRSDRLRVIQVRIG